MPATQAWVCSFTLQEIPEGSYLAIPIHGKHGIEGAYAALRVDGKPVGAPDRAVSFPSNTWEYPVRQRDQNYTYYVPLHQNMVGKTLDAVVLGLNKEITDLKPEVWITTYPIPYKKRELMLK